MSVGLSPWIGDHLRHEVYRSTVYRLTSAAYILHTLVSCYSVPRYIAVRLLVSKVTNSKNNLFTWDKSAADVNAWVSIIDITDTGGNPVEFVELPDPLSVSLKESKGKVRTDRVLVYKAGVRDDSTRGAK